MRDMMEEDDKGNSPCRLYVPLDRLFGATLVFGGDLSRSSELQNRERGSN